MRLIAGRNQGWRVWCDGVLLERVFRCDTDEGWAVVARVDAQGNVVIEDDVVLEDVVQGTITAAPMFFRENNDGMRVQGTP
jgi:hypothetical protein